MNPTITSFWNYQEAFSRNLGLINLAEKGAQCSRPHDPMPRAIAIERILDMARWTPSGDNSQPWQFEIVEENKILLHIAIPSLDKDIMSIRDGEPTLLITGMMLETLTIAAGKEGKTLSWKHLAQEKSGGENQHRFEITFQGSNNSVTDSLYDYIPLRYTNRKHYRVTPLTDMQKRALEAALGDKLTLRWHSGWGERWRVAKLNMQAFLIRMKSRIAYEQLRERIDWQYPFSTDKLPLHTLPMTMPSRHIMRWAMGSWRRLRALGKIPGAILLSAIEIELLPALLCGNHFILRRKNAHSLENRVAATIAEGRALMRFWLTITKLGLTMQPSYSPIAFAEHGSHPDNMPREDWHLAPECQSMAKKLEAISGCELERLVFMGRIGTPRTSAVASRSLRKPLDELWRNN